ncbi:helix-turn-helix domain-containing protein [Vibrio mangrovi]|uniref:HTH-type transcriptional activator RhaS n=1 Tax=Vibrio mangrovi TaxID=474394 RepID=A0A1Y6ISL1_9VIBR|nr:helix-turn-helix domain-containing protein [Vibrio mangrovi]MDW6001361.1 helix-turn-helix domain-containing protein [Vibrio mangrovi]SMS00616.1 HTH-type transcriptional activator RhaS [Vibrio mangrovi]
MIYLNSNEFFIDSQSPVATELRSPQEPFPEHAHSFEEIIIVSSGNGIHVMNDIPMNLSKNYVCFVKREDRHLFENVDKLYLSNVLFDKSRLSLSSTLSKYMPSPADENHGWFINENAAERIHQLVERLHIESHTDSEESRILTQSLFQQLIIELWRGKIQPVDMLNSDDKVISALAHINNNYAELMELESVAEMAQLSPRQLTKSIKHLTGMNYNQYIHYIRASKALSQLLYTDRPITDIAFQVGYQDSNYFSTKFKQVFNMTPRDARLRKENQTLFLSK